MIKHILISMRPKQWTKNILIFAGIIFAEKLFCSEDLIRVVFAFVLFSLSSGGMYIINDIIDRKSDMVHPNKKNRPVASGALSIPIAWVSSLLLILLSLFLSYFLSKEFLLVLTIYLILMFLYSIYLKRIVLIDIMSIAFGFILRTFAGCVVIVVSLSPWLFMCTLLLALFIAASKRRQEIISLGSDAKEHRISLSGYSSQLIDQIVVIVTACTLIAYTLYTLSPQTIEKFGGYGLVFTVPFVLYGIMRYFYLIHQEGKGDSPDRIFIEDKPLFIDILLWILSVIFIIYKF